MRGSGETGQASWERTPGVAPPPPVHPPVTPSVIDEGPDDSLTPPIFGISVISGRRLNLLPTHAHA